MALVTGSQVQCYHIETRAHCLCLPQPPPRPLVSSAPAFWYGNTFSLRECQGLCLLILCPQCSPSFFWEASLNRVTFCIQTGLARVSFCVSGLPSQLYPFSLIVLTTSFKVGYCAILLASERLEGQDLIHIWTLVPGWTSCP